MVRLLLFIEDPLYTQTGFAMRGILHIRFAKIAFGKAQVVYGIQQISFAAAVFAAKANNVFMEGERTGSVIPELEK